MGIDNKVIEFRGRYHRKRSEFSKQAVDAVVAFTDAIPIFGQYFRKEPDVVSHLEQIAKKIDGFIDIVDIRARDIHGEYMLIFKPHTDYMEKEPQMKKLSKLYGFLMKKNHPILYDKLVKEELMEKSNTFTKNSWPIFILYNKSA